MKLSVNLVVFNGEKYLPFALKSLSEQSLKDFSILIIDNNSQDNSVKFIEDYLENPKHKLLASVTRLIKNSKNLGFAPAHNQAIQWTNSDYVFLMNQDVILDKNYLKTIVGFLDDNPLAASVSGKVYQWDFDKIEAMVTDNAPLTGQGKTDKIDTLGLKIFPNHKVTELTDEHFPDTFWQELPQEIFGVSGALAVYRRQALEISKIPLFFKSFKLYINQTKPKLYEYFDNDFFSYKEDVDIAYRLRLLGFKSYLVPQAVAWHDRSAASGSTIRKSRKAKSKFINRHSFKNHFYFLFKNVPAKIWLKFFHRIIAYEFFKFLYILILEPSTLVTFKEIFSNLTKMLKKRAYLKKKAGPNAWRNIEPWLKK